jgi:hypothetical protein
MLLKSVVNDAETMYRQIYDNHAALISFLTEIHMPFPQALSVTAEFVINATLGRALQDDPLDLGRIHTLLETAKRENITLDSPGLSYALSGRINSLMQSFAAMPDDLENLQRMNLVFNMVNRLPFQVNLWKVQNLYYGLLQSLFSDLATKEAPESKLWAREFAALGEKLGIAVDSIAPSEPQLQAA